MANASSTEHGAAGEACVSDLLEAFERDGFARLRGVLRAADCRDLAQAFDDDTLYRSTVDMRRHQFGSGVYRYYAYPLPVTVATLRDTWYPCLAGLANAWYEQLNIATRFPHRHEDYRARCHAAGQQRPTPLVLRYRAGDHNRLHQDLYGDEVFPLQLVVMLSRPGEDFTGGELVLVEQRPRQQSRATVVPFARGDAVVVPVSIRPGRGARGFHRIGVRHGVSTVLSGERLTLGIIFHDAA